jgi:hypothetical protein
MAELEAIASFGPDPVADREDGVEVVVLDLASHLPRPFTANL